MAKYIYDGVIKVSYVPTIADTAAPTITEIGAGVDLTPFLLGLDPAFEGSTVDAATAESKFNKTVAGTYGGQPLNASFTRDNEQANDTAWSTLPRTTSGYFVIAMRGGSGTDGAIAATDYVDVWPIEVITRKPSAYSRNGLASFEVSSAVTDTPDEDVTVAAAA